MLNSIKLKINDFFYKGHSRTVLAKKNIAASFIIKGGSIIIGLLLVPMTIGYINPTQYGIWLTISSVVSWMSFFDIGLGNGLRNNLTEALALNEFEVAKKLVSTTYATLFIISFFIFIIFYCVNLIIDWNKFLNIPLLVSDKISLAVLLVVGSFCATFVLQLINTILTAVHKPAKAGLIVFFGQLGVLISIYILTNTLASNFIVLILFLTLIPVFTFLVASFYLFNTDLKYLCPNLRFVDFSYVKQLFKIGGYFFIIQIGSIVLIQTDNIIISKIIGPDSVTQFNVALKYFSIVIMFFSIIMVPYWSAFADAKAQKDYEWIRRTVFRIRKVWFLISVFVVPIMYLLSGFIFKWWIGDSVRIPNSLSALLCFYVVSYICLNMNSYFLNGIGKIKLQFYLYLIVCVLNIPLCSFLAMKMGVNGVVISNLFAFFFMNVILWIQTNKIISRSDEGVWSK